MMNAMLRIFAVAGLVAATFAALADFKTCDGNAQSTNVFTQAFVDAQAEFSVYSMAFIDAQTEITAAKEALSTAGGAAFGAVTAQAGQGKCVDVAITTAAIAIAQAFAKATASISAVVTAEASAFAKAYISLFAYSQAAVESCSCPANSELSTTSAASDLFVNVSSVAEQFFMANVEVETVAKAWSSAIIACEATPRVCIINNRVVSSVKGTCGGEVEAENVICSRITNPAARARLGCPPL